MRVVSETEFSKRLVEVLSETKEEFGFVTGPGRSGAIASVYSSHLLRIPFVPFNSLPEREIGKCLIVDTAESSGRTIRKALRRYEDYSPSALAFFKEPPRVRFWYEEIREKLLRERLETMETNVRLEET